MRKAQWKIDGLYRIGLSTLTCKGNKRHRQKWKVRSIAERKRHAFKSMCFRRVRKREWRKTKRKRERETERESESREREIERERGRGRG